MVEREDLERRLSEGASIDAIARAEGVHPSTAAYWVNKHGLASLHAARHAARGGLTRETLEPLVAAGLSIRQIAARVDRSPATVRHWLERHGLRTRRANEPRSPDAHVIVRECRKHGFTAFVRYGANDHHRCERCRKERVAARRRRVKQILVAEAGGRCAMCGYDRHPAALHFHHVDPAEKEFGLALQGVARSLERARAEAAKCVLLCANCHAEVEAGFATLR